MAPCQGFREAPWIKCVLVVVDRPGGMNDTPGEDDEGRGAGYTRLRAGQDRS